MWNKVKLGEVLKQTTDWIKPNPEEKYKLLGLSLEGRGLFVREEKTGLEISATQLNKVRTKDFIYSRLFAWKGAFDLVSEKFEDCYVSNEFPTFELNTNKINGKYLASYFKSPKIWTLVETFCTGSTKASRNRFKEKFFLDIEIPLPPISEQLVIVEKLENATAKLKQIKQLRAESLKETEMLKSGFIDNILNELKAKYEIVNITEIAKLARGRFSHRPRNAPHLFDNGIYPFIQTGEVTNAKNHDIKYTQLLNEEGLKVSKMFEAPIILITIAANIGNTAILKYNACFTDSIVGIKPNENADIYFLEFYLQSLKEYLNSIATQSAQKNLNIEKLSTITVPLPPLEIQNQIVNEIENFNKKIEEIKQLQQKTEAEITAMEKSILNKYIQTN